MSSPSRARSLEGVVRRRLQKNSAGLCILRYTLWGARCNTSLVLHDLTCIICLVQVGCLLQR